MKNVLSDLWLLPSGASSASGMSIVVRTEGGEEFLADYVASRRDDQHR